MTVLHGVSNVRIKLLVQKIYPDNDVFVAFPDQVLAFPAIPDRLGAVYVQTSQPERRTSFRLGVFRSGVTSSSLDKPTRDTVSTASSISFLMKLFQGTTRSRKRLCEMRWRVSLQRTINIYSFHSTNPYRVVVQGNDQTRSSMS